jgi:2-isopropylmalate synthase
MPTATVRLKGPHGEFRTQAEVGTGPVHAVFRAIDQIVEAPSELLEYSINAVTEGIDALGHASVRVRAAKADAKPNPQHAGSSPIFHGHAADTDVIVASTKAYLNALNRVLAALGTHEPRSTEVPVSDSTSGAAE